MPFGKVENLQDIIFENRGAIREDVFVKLMDSLQGAQNQENNQAVIVKCIYYSIKPSTPDDQVISCIGTDFHVKMVKKEKILSMTYEEYEAMAKDIEKDGISIRWSPIHLRRYKRVVGIDTNHIVHEDSDDDEESYEEGHLTLCTDNVAFIKAELLKPPVKNDLLEKTTKERGTNTACSVDSAILFS